MPAGAAASGRAYGVGMYTEQRPFQASEEYGGAWRPWVGARLTPARPAGAWPPRGRLDALLS